MLPFVLVRDGVDVVPVLAGMDESGLVGFDFLREEERLLSFETGDVIGTVSSDPAAVFYGMQLELARPAALPLAAERGTKVYWEDLPEEEKARLRERRLAELRAIGEMAFPVPGFFAGDEPVEVLGPVHRFPPYDDPAYGKPTLQSNAQLMLRKPDGSKFIAFGESVWVGGKPLLAAFPPMREKLSPFERRLERLRLGIEERRGGRRGGRRLGIEDPIIPFVPILENPVVPRFAPLGYKFQPLPEGTVSGFPSAHLARQRLAVPSIEAIRLSAIFAGSAIMTTAPIAERAYGCMADIYRQRGFVPLEEVRHCFRQSGFHEQRAALYEESGEWAPLVEEAIRKGLRDRELRKHLFLETTTPEGIGLAKLSFTLALLGHDVVCLDIRLLRCMFGDDAAKAAGTWSRPSELSLRRYEQAEKAFLKGNRHYDPKDVLGKARAQWASWESIGEGKPAPTWCRRSRVTPATHSVWLKAVTA